MTFLDYTKLIRRHLFAAIVLTLLVMLSTFILVQIKNSSPYETTVFISIGSAEDAKMPPQGNNYENVQAADQFSETVQGWFKNPDFTKGIRPAGSSEMSVRKQEKQNLLVTFTSPSDEQAQEMSTHLHNDLQKEIEQYNTATGSRFILAIFETNLDSKTLSLPLFLLIGLIGGAFVASFGLYGCEYLFQKISSSTQAADILGKQPIERLASLKTDKLHFLSAYLHKSDKNIQLVGAGASISQIVETLKHFHNKMEGVNFPEESQKLKMNDRHVIVCILGKTQTEDLQKLRALLTDFDLVIVEA